MFYTCRLHQNQHEQNDDDDDDDEEDNANDDDDDDITQATSEGVVQRHNQNQNGGSRVSLR